MNTNLTSISAAHARHDTPIWPPAILWTRIQNLASRLRRRRDIELGNLNSRMLSDIGITRQELGSAASESPDVKLVALRGRLGRSF